MYCVTCEWKGHVKFPNACQKNMNEKISNLATGEI